VSAADDLAKLLKQRNVRVVFAESCTAGLVAARLGEMPGISAYLCGSAVTYREATKVAWLGVKPEDLETFTAVSDPVAEQMALGVLQKTAEADYAAAITGHLGPDAPEGFDGVVIIASAWRDEAELRPFRLCLKRLQATGRLPRRAEAAELVFRELQSCIEATHALRQR